MRRFHLMLAGVLAALLSLVGLAGVADASALPDPVASLSASYLHGTCVEPRELQPIEGHTSTTDEPVHGAAASRVLAYGCIHRYDYGWQPLARVIGEPSYRYDGIGRTASALCAPSEAAVAAEDRLAAGEGVEGADGLEGATGSVSKIANRFGYSAKQVREAIHTLKRGATLPGNPDVVVTLDGEVYPVGPDGVAGDSIGNILDVLEESS